MRKFYTEERHIARTIKRLKANWTGHVLHRNCLVKHTADDTGKDSSEGKTRKKTPAATGWP
jgi:hypothetical protein